MYCYARDAVYSRHGRDMVIYANLRDVIRRELERLELCPPVSLSNITDPCQEVPRLRRTVLKLVEELVAWGVSFHFITKGDPSFLEEVEGFPGPGRFFLAVTIEGPPEVLEVTSPQAPPYHRRLEAVKWASSRGLPVLVRLDPVILPLWRALYGRGWRGERDGLLEDFAAAGASHVVSSTGRFTAATLSRIRREVEKRSTREAAAMDEDYVYDSATSRGYMLRRPERLAFHLENRAACARVGMTYAVCQELRRDEADTPGLPHCERFPMPFSVRSGPRSFRPLEGCSADCHHSCAGLSEPPCGRPELARPRPFRPSSLRRRTRVPEEGGRKKEAPQRL
jgi:DNA repair photolyase